MYIWVYMGMVGGELLTPLLVTIDIIFPFPYKFSTASLPPLLKISNYTTLFPIYNL